MSKNKIEQAFDKVKKMYRVISVTAFYKSSIKTKEFSQASKVKQLNNDIDLLESVTNGTLSFGDFVPKRDELVEHYIESGEALAVRSPGTIPLNVGTLELVEVFITFPEVKRENYKGKILDDLGMVTIYVKKNQFSIGDNRERDHPYFAPAYEIMEKAGFKVIKE